MASLDWLRVEATPQGVVLSEDQHAYETIPDNTEHHVALAIGARTKTTLLNATCYNTKDNQGSIRFCRFSPALTFIDCDLHSVKSLGRTPVRYRASPTKHPLSTTLLHNDNHYRISLFAYDLYWRLLTPLSSLLLLFLDDVGGPLGVADIVVRWVRQAMLDPRCSHPPKLLIVTDNPVLKLPALRKVFVTKLMASLSVAESYRSRTLADVESLLSATFEVIEVTSATPCAIARHVSEACRKQQQSRYAFNGAQLKHLFHEAIIHFTRNTSSSIDPQFLARKLRPVPVNLAQNLLEFTRLTQNAILDQAEVIASALELDAYPPNMHFFPPSSTFDKFYQVAVDLSAATFQAPTVRDIFIRLALERRGRSSLQSHLRVLQKYQMAWSCCHSTSVCLLCLAHKPRRAAFGCGHKLCEKCVALVGVSDVGSFEFHIAKCPLCHAYCDISISLRPPTAGTRVLRLNAGTHQKEALYGFLKSLQTLIGLPMWPLRKQFDLVVASGIGAYFAHTLIAENWTLDDCKHHLAKVGYPKLKRRSGSIVYGKNLDWDTKSIENFNGPKISIDINGKLLHNGAWIENEPDVIVDFVNGAHLADVAAKLIASLFYIELESYPRLAEGKYIITLYLRCRVPSGPPLMSVLMKLKVMRAQLRYRSDKSTHRVCSLVDWSTLQDCRAGSTFLRVFTMQVATIDSVLDLMLEAIPGLSANISNCPYTLSKLILDQGIGFITGRTDHTAGDVLNDEMSSLHDILEEIYGWV